MFNFEKLDVYKESLDFVTQIYKIIKNFPKNEQFCLIEQIKRASISVPANISEGSGRKGKDFLHFLIIARSSLYECFTLLQISASQRYVTFDEYKKLIDKIDKISAMISALINSLKEKSYRTTDNG